MHSQFGSKGKVPAILGTADATHYLVGAMDDKDNFVGLNAVDDIVTVRSLPEAKQLLREHNISVATLEYQSAYDEMCGQNCESVCRQYISI